MEEEDDKIERPTNSRKQTISVTLYRIEKQLEFIHNEIKEINNRLEKEILTNIERYKIKSKESILNQNIKVFKNDLIQLNKKIKDYIFEYTRSRMLNNNSIYLDDFWFYEIIVNIFNVSDLLVDKKTLTYSIEKNTAVLLIDRIIPDSHPNVFQFSFSIQNLKNDSYMEI
jgi:hypothetical protein